MLGPCSQNYIYMLTHCDLIVMIYCPLAQSHPMHDYTRVQVAVISVPYASHPPLQVLLPPGYVYTEALVKTARPDGKTPIVIQIASPPIAAGPVDVTVWFRPTSQ